MSGALTTGNATLSCWWTVAPAVTQMVEEEIEGPECVAFLGVRGVTVAVLSTEHTD